MNSSSTAQFKTAHPELLYKAWATFRAVGPLGLARACGMFAARRYHDWREGRLDRRFGIDTRSFESEMHGENYYEPIQLDVFREILLALPIEPRDYCFIDIGSGKGRALILAAEAGFGRVVGVEFAPAFHAMALHNIALYERARRGARPIEALLQDATTYVLPRCQSVLFLYNPFNEATMRTVLHRVETSWRCSPRDLVIVYRTPTHARVFDGSTVFKPLLMRSAYHVYRARPPEGRHDDPGR
jgi:SAM-dependent methyltransferase